MRCCVSHWFCTFRNRCENSSLPNEDLSRVISYRVIDNHELSRCPSITASVFFHVVGEVHKDFVGQRRVITINNGELRVIPFVNPAGVCSYNLVKERLVAVGRNSYCGKALRDDSAVTVLVPLERGTLLRSHSLGVLFSLDIVHRFPRASQSRGSVIFQRSHLAVLDSE